MRTLNEDAIEYDSGRLFRDELGYTEIIWGLRHYLLDFLAQRFLDTQNLQNFYQIAT